MKNWLANLYISAIFSWLYIPVFVLVIFSFNLSHYSMQWHGFTWQWYRELFLDRDLWEACVHSIMLGISAAFFATIISLFAVMQLFLIKNKKNSKLQLMLFALIMVPDLVLGVSLLVFFNKTNIPLGFTSLLITHVTFCIPFSLITLQAQMNTLDPNIYYSALDLGASKMRAFYKIMLPLIAPAIFSSFILNFTLSFDDVLTSYFVAGPEYSILPLTIYSLVRSGVTPELNALCTVTLSFSVILVVTANRLTGKLL